MKLWGSADLRRSIKVAIALIAVFVCLPAFASADQKSEAREQFERAVRMRTMLEGYLPRDRALSDYQQTIAAYHKVYLISWQAAEVPSSLIAEAELYREMGHQFDPKYFQSAIDTYNLLLKEYPGTRYRGEAEFVIAQIQKDDQNQPGVAEATFKDFLKRYPKSDRAADARAALKQITDSREKPKTIEAKSFPSSDELPENGPIIEPHESETRVASVKELQTFNAGDHARIVVALEDTVQYESMHLPSPDRIYFDLHRAKLGPKLEKSIEFQSGLLKSIRVAQNRPDIVRVVLDASGAKDCTAVLLGNPYRLVIDLHAEPGAAIASTTTAPPSAPAVPSTAEKPAEAIAAKTVPADALEPGVKLDKTAVASTSRLSSAKTGTATNTAVLKPVEPKPTRDGQRSLTRTLGLKIGRIVIDPGHGGHDTGTIGPHGLMEKDLCLDVALRLGREIETKLPGAEVIYTRKDDTFIPLEQRTAIANDAKADLFISIHANSSRDHEARGIETYYLNFATSPESMEVATRENAYSEKSLHDLQDLIQKIARNEKVEESKELAADIQDSLTHRLQLISQNERDRGVKRAPFIVLIGANMPSVLSEISFVSNPTDERLLRKNDQRQRIADGLYRGISAYLESLGSLSYNKQKLVSDNHPGDNPSAASPTPSVTPK